VVLVLNALTTTNRLRVNQPWVDAVLGTHVQPHVFAISHLPAFKVFHTDCLGAYSVDRNSFWSSLRGANCRMYFSGHDHFYDHARIDDRDGNPDNDIHQFILGTGGGAFYPDYAYNGDNLPYDPVRVLHEPAHGYLRVEVDGYRVTATWCRRTGPGEFTPTPEVFTYVAQPKLTVATSGADLVLTWTEGAALQAAAVPSGPFTNVLEATPPFLVRNLAAPSMFYRLAIP
jgi:hypothetical protein